MANRKRHPRWKYTEDRGPGRVSDIFPAGVRYHPITNIDFLAWSPDPEPGRTQPTQLYLVLEVAGFELERILLRLKTPESVDAIIHELEHYRARIWGRPGESTIENP